MAYFLLRLGFTGPHDTFKVEASKSQSTPYDGPIRFEFFFPMFKFVPNPSKPRSLIEWRLPADQ